MRKLCAAQKIDHQKEHRQDGHAQAHHERQHWQQIAYGRRLRQCAVDWTVAGRAPTRPQLHEHIERTHVRTGH